MPLVYLFTNLKESALKEGIEDRIAQTIAETLGKPLEKMSVIIVPGTRLLRLRTTEPACTLHIHAINVFDAERNPRYGPSIKKLLKDELGLEEERCAIIYHDLIFEFIG
ncbi:unnamed protein product [Candidula unifasciata]|uniref:D-dopachrome decarboxylase n=1 Tax=Candidula unifasciata TaxID=100452 RepID=A0A8S4A2B0_9EUPU|nr:unnamed protein product [Candidula unifasciata]